MNLFVIFCVTVVVSCVCCIEYHFLCSTWDFAVMCGCAKAVPLDPPMSGEGSKTELVSQTA